MNYTHDMEHSPTNILVTLVAAAITVFLGHLNLGAIEATGKGLTPFWEGFIKIVALVIAAINSKKAITNFVYIDLPKWGHKIKMFFKRKKR